MAKQRVTKKKSTWGNWEYPTDGEMSFSCLGYVQKVTEGKNEDYVRFYLDNPFKSGNTNSFDVTVPWDDDLPMLEVGDHVNIFGLCRSWWEPDLEIVKYTFVAQQIQVIEDQKAPEPEMPVKSRRGIKKPVE